jgi:hypothetical protein
MVRAAYSSGTPAIGVGPANTPTLICADADPDQAARAVVMSKSFYESDCQGHTPPSLIAERLFPEQSAPIPDWARPIGTAGVWAQSASASFSSLELPIRPGRLQALGRADANHGSIRDSALGPA